MEIEETLEALRLRLLRHLARLIAVVAFMSRGPFGNRVPRWVRSLVIYLLRPAEDAANCLVGVMARILSHRELTLQPGPGLASISGRDDLSFLDTESALAAPETGLMDEDTVSTEGLYRRLRALQDVLEDLPGHARRLMREQRRQRAKAPRPEQPKWLRNSVEPTDLKSLFFRFEPLARRWTAPP